MLLGKGIMINWNNVRPEHRAAYDAWHCHEHMVGRLKIPGFLRGRRYIAHDARRNFLTVYEVLDLDVLTGADYLAKANAPSALTLSTTPRQPEKAANPSVMACAPDSLVAVPYTT